eukprot:4833191-Ditylum_brightwellii.AAC.1
MTSTDQPYLKMTNIDWSLLEDMTIIQKIKNDMVGLEGEVYVGGPMGFCAEQTEDGLSAHPEDQRGAEKKNPVQEDL